MRSTAATVRGLGLCFSLFCCTSMGVGAETFVGSTTSQGDYSSFGNRWGLNSTIAVGFNGTTYRSFLIYDLAAVDAGASVSSGTLTFPAGNLGGLDVGPLTLQLAAFGHDPALLAANPSVDAFNALGAGTLLQSFTLSESGGFVLTLEALALAYLQDALSDPTQPLVFALRSADESANKWFSFSSPTLTFGWAPAVPDLGSESGGGSGAGAAAAAAASRQAAHRQMQAQQKAAQRVAAQRVAAQHRRNQQR